MRNIPINTWVELIDDDLWASLGFNTINSENVVKMTTTIPMVRWVNPNRTILIIQAEQYGSHSVLLKSFEW